MKNNSRNYNIPENSYIDNYLPADYVDAISCDMDAVKNLNSAEIMQAFWTMQPKWIQSLFSLRNILVKPFGLETGDNKKEIKLEVKEGVSTPLISFLYVTDEETIGLLSDKHLDAYISVLMKDKTPTTKTVTTITLVKHHNFLGKAYFFFIKPFHKIVVKRQLKYIAKEFRLKE